jgi:ribosomal 30S subunit maturation factor RimM
MHLIDLEVYDEKGLLLGTVKEVLQTGAMMSMLITIFREGHFDTMPLRI